MDGDSSVECNDCGSEYQRLGSHWGHGCSPPTPTYEQEQMIIGALMGDGSMTGPKRSRQFRLYNTNKEFLEWFDKKMGVLTTGIKIGRTPEEHVKDLEKCKDRNFDAEDYNTQYYVSSRAIDYFKQFDDWYSSGRKNYPENLSLTPPMLKLWYVTDGTLVEKEYERPYIRIADSNEIKHNSRGEFLIKLFDEVGFDATVTSECVKIYKDSIKPLFNWMGDSPPGFEYKWPNRGNL